MADTISELVRDVLAIANDPAVADGDARRQMAAIVQDYAHNFYLPRADDLDAGDDEDAR